MSPQYCRDRAEACERLADSVGPSDRIYTIMREAASQWRRLADDSEVHDKRLTQLSWARAAPWSVSDESFGALIEEFSSHTTRCWSKGDSNYQSAPVDLLLGPITGTEREPRFVEIVTERGDNPFWFGASFISTAREFGSNIGNSHPAKRATSVLNRSVTKCQ